MPAPFQRAVYDGSDATQRMSNLLARRGAINADLYLRQGDAAANTAQAIGSGVGQFMSDLLRYKADEPRRALLEQETAQRKYTLNKQEQADNDKQMADAFIAKYTTVGEDGTVTVDDNGIKAAFLKTGRKDLADEYEASVQKAELDAIKAKSVRAQWEQLRSNGMAGLAADALRFGKKTGDYTTPFLLAIKKAEASGFASPEEIKQFQETALTGLFDGAVGVVERSQKIHDLLQSIAKPEPVEIKSFSPTDDIVAVSPSGVEVLRPGTPKPEGFNLSDTGARFERGPDGTPVLVAKGPRYGAREPAGTAADKPLSAREQALVDSVIKNPSLYSDLSAETKARLAPALTARGFSQFGKQAQKKPPTGAERTTLVFFNRAKQADEELARVEATITGMNLGEQAWLKWAPNFMQTDEGQTYQTAQRQFTEARLRKDSGAAIPESEFENDRRMYFAQPGDTPETAAVKARARAQVLASLARASGNALEEHYGDEGESLITGYRDRAKVPDPSYTESPTTPPQTNARPGLVPAHPAGAKKVGRFLVQPE